MNTIVIAGGTGFLGDYLKLCFEQLGYNVLVVSRTKGNVSWDEADLLKAIDNCEAVFNLAGKSINCRHNDKNKQVIISSRITTTQLIGNAILACKNPPSLWINASATGIYLPSRNHFSEESDTETSNDFIAQVVKEWETTFFSFHLPLTRQLALRTSVVLGQNGGALQKLSRLASIGLGGKQADGQQLFSWVHIDDYFRIIRFVMREKQLSGVVNCTAPNPVSNSELMRALRHSIKVRIGLPTPKFAINVGAKILGTDPELILNSSNVIPKKLIEAGYVFKFSAIENALNNLFA
jgi:uncharacterized protein (TIGR01777 family)